MRALPVDDLTSLELSNLDQQSLTAWVIMIGETSSSSLSFRFSELCQLSEAPEELVKYRVTQARC